MIRILYTLLVGGAIVTTPLGAKAQPEEAQKPCPLFEGAAEGHFLALIEGDSITLPCSWSDLKRLGWQFSNSLDGEEILAPLDNTIRLTSVKPIVANTRTGQTMLLFCNTDSVAQTRSECLVFGIQTGAPDSSGFNTGELPGYMQGEASTDFYAFELPGGIRGGASTEKDVVAAYGTVSYVLGVSTEKGYKRLLSYTSEAEKPEVKVQVCTDEEGKQAGVVTGFIARTEGVIKHYIAKNPGLISDYEADSLIQRDYMTGRLEKMIAQLEQSEGRDKAEIAEEQREVGDIYYHAMGDKAEGLRWYLLAAQGGDHTAQFNVGICYNNGDGVKQDFGESIKWYNAAAEQGDAEAMNNLGYAYEEGEGAEKDLDKSLEWYERAAEAGSAQAMINCAYSHLTGKGGKANNEAGFKWAEKAVYQEQYIPAYVILGYCYHYGKGVDRNIDTARHWYEIACNTGDKTAHYNMGVIYYNAKDKKHDYGKAFEYFSKADQTDLLVQLALAECYFRGRGTAKDPEKAAHYYHSCLQELEARNEALTPEEQKNKKTIIRLLGGKLKKFN